MALKIWLLSAMLMSLSACASFKNMHGDKGNDFYLTDQHLETWGAAPAKKKSSVLVFFSSQDPTWPAYVGALNAALEETPEPGLLAIDLDISDPAKSASDCERLGAKFSVAPGTPNLAKAWGAKLPLKAPYSIILKNGQISRQAEIKAHAAHWARFLKSQN